MTTLCECGHYKSQHPNKVCDYAGHSCNCTGYKRQQAPEKTDDEVVRAVTNALRGPCKLYRVANTASNYFVVAHDDEEALEVAMRRKLARSRENLRILSDRCEAYMHGHAGSDSLRALLATGKTGLAHMSVSGVTNAAEVLALLRRGEKIPPSTYAWELSQ